MEEIKEDLREIKAELKTVSSTLVRNTMSLELHEKRTHLAEGRIERLEQKSMWVLGLILTAVLGVFVKDLFH